MLAERRRLEARLRNLSAETAADFATADEIRRTVEKLGGMVGLLQVTQPKLRSRFYEEVGLTATSIRPPAPSRLSQTSVCVRFVSEGGT